MAKRKMFMMAGNPAHVAVVGKMGVILLYYCRSDALRQPGVSGFRGSKSVTRFTGAKNKLLHGA